MALNPERQSARKSKTKNGRLASLASNPLVTVSILELWAKWVKTPAVDHVHFVHPLALAIT